MESIKKYVLSAGVVVIFVLYAIKLRFGEHDDHARVVIPNTAQTPISTPVAIVDTPTNIPTPSLKPVGKYKDGTYIGQVTDAFYGNVQVKAVILDGKITDVVFLQYPNDRGTSIEINSQAIPILRQEAIAVQSAKVDGASGATQTSIAFIQSLQSALDQAN